MLMHCNGCHITKEPGKGKGGAERIPYGWRRIADGMLCAACFADRYSMRMIYLPIAKPLNGEWADLWQGLTETWQLSTAVMNYIVARLWSADQETEWPEKGHPPLPMSRTEAYAAARKKFPTLPSGPMDYLVVKAIEAYQKKRRRTAQFHTESVPSFKYPYPSIWRACDWTLEWDDAPVIKFGVGDRRGKDRWAVELRQGRDFARQLRAVRKLISGEAIGAHLLIKRARGSTGSHRKVFEEKQPGGGQKKQWRLEVGIGIYLPKEPKRILAGRLFVRTLPDSFLVARGERDQRNGWFYHADHIIRSKIAAHRWRLQRTSDDLKAKRRRSRGALNEKRLALVEKHHRRVDTFLHQVSADLVKYAKGRRVATVVLDDSDHSFLGRGPYTKLRELITYKLDQAGIEFKTIENLKTDKEKLGLTDEYAQAETILKAMMETQDDDGTSGDA